MAENTFVERVRKVADMVGGQLMLAQKTGISARTINAYALGESEPSMAKLVSIAKAANVSAGWLATGEGPMRPGEGEEKAEEQETLSPSMKGKGERYPEVPLEPINATMAPGPRPEDAFDALGMAEGMGLLAEIYSSKDATYIRAINANLLAFSDAVKTKARAVVLEQTIHQMQAQMLQMQEQINELKQEVLRLRNENSELKRELRSRGGNDAEVATG